MNSDYSVITINIYKTFLHLQEYKNKITIPDLIFLMSAKIIE